MNFSFIKIFSNQKLCSQLIIAVTRFPHFCPQQQQSLLLELLLHPAEGHHWAGSACGYPCTKQTGPAAGVSVLRRYQDSRERPQWEHNNRPCPTTPSLKPNSKIPVNETQMGKDDPARLNCHNASLWGALFSNAGNLGLLSIQKHTVTQVLHSSTRP